MNNSIKYLIAMLSFWGMTSCDDSSFLAEKPETFYTIDNIFSSQDQVDQCIYTCYDRVGSMFCPRNNWDVWGSKSWRMSNGTDMFDAPSQRYDYRMNDYSILSSQTGYFYDTYAQFYYLITSANTAIYAADLEGLTWDSEESKKNAQAQARFFRAFAYRNLGELFGGVPIVTELVTTPRYNYERSSRLETYQFAIDELEAIENDIPEEAPAGRIVRAVVQHNLTQLYIDKGIALQEEGQDAIESYKKAIGYADKIIDGGRYSLMTQRFGTRANENPEYYYANSKADQTAEHTYASAGYSIQGNVYWDLFQPGNQDYQSGNKEAIWVTQTDANLAQEEGEKFRLYYSAMYGPVFRDQGGEYINGNLEDVGGLGMCQVCPTEYARDLIYEGKWADDMRNSEAVWRRLILGNRPGTKYYGKPVGWDIIYRKDENGKPDEKAWSFVYPISCKISTDKYIGENNGYDYTSLFRDDYIIRLPETILLRAEAYMRIGNNDKAAQDINKLRERAQCGYLVTAGDVNLDLILDERARELIYEECRWNTLLRMGGTVATDRIKKYAYWDCARTTLANKQFNLFPIPQTVIDTNKDVVLNQNPGW